MYISTLCGMHAKAVWRVQCKNVVVSFLLFFSTVLFASAATAANLKVMKTGLGGGTVTTASGTINCGVDCSQFYLLGGSEVLAATPAAGSTFVRWLGDCSGTTATCPLSITSNRSVRAEFAIAGGIPALTDFSPLGIQAYLAANPSINTPAKFIAALPVEYRRNWVLMSRSESLQTGTAQNPRILLPSGNAQRVFSVGTSTHSSYPGSHPNAVEYMQWDATEKNFRFHEIVLTNIGVMGSVPARTRGVSVDDSKCTRCHSTQNVLNTSSSPGTTGIPPGIVKAKSKPNWDAYDSWAGMLPFNRDRIYQGSVEAAAFRTLFNPWTWAN
ncbi:MAG: hypothetical protein OEW08_14500, partial [Gammaproteobacteria bacterium]|nr:hypothetical protein [Gammaproteobacteria bacterium]